MEEIELAGVRPCDAFIDSERSRAQATTIDTEAAFLPGWTWRGETQNWLSNARVTSQTWLMPNGITGVELPLLAHHQCYVLCTRLDWSEESERVLGPAEPCYKNWQQANRGRFLRQLVSTTFS